MEDPNLNPLPTPSPSPSPTPLNDSSMLVPYKPRHLAVVPPNPTAISSSRFTIPRGWGIEEIPRRDGSRSDMYYYEPGTGKRFRSIREVNRHLRGGEFPCRSSPRKLRIRNHISGFHMKKIFSTQKNPRCRRMVVSGGKLLKPDSRSKKAAPAAPYTLPDGWIVEEVPRKHSNWSDRYYYEPGTGQKFRSLAAVKRYLAELDGDNVPLSRALEEIKENKPLSKIFKLESHTKNSTPRSKSMNGEKKQSSSVIGPPSKVHWVIASAHGDEWSPFISETLVPDSVQQQWKSKFMVVMNDESFTVQSA